MTQLRTGSNAPGMKHMGFRQRLQACWYIMRGIPVIVGVHIPLDPDGYFGGVHGEEGQVFSSILAYGNHDIPQYWYDQVFDNITSDDPGAVDVVSGRCGCGKPFMHPGDCHE